MKRGTCPYKLASQISHLPGGALSVRDFIRLEREHSPPSPEDRARAFAKWVKVERCWENATPHFAARGWGSALFVGWGVADWRHLLQGSSGSPQGKLWKFINRVHYSTSPAPPNQRHIVPCMPTRAKSQNTFGQ